MEQTKNAGSKHYKSFWPLVIILVVAIVAAGFVYWFQINLEQEYDLNSIVIRIHKRDTAPTAHKTVLKAKTAAETVTSTK